MGRNSKVFPKEEKGKIVRALSFSFQKEYVTGRAPKKWKGESLKPKKNK